MNNQTLANQKAIEVTERQRQAVELRKAGAGFEEIARQLGYKDASGAYRAVKAALRKTIQQPADELRALEAARLDAMLLGIYADARKGNVLKIDRVLKIMARRADLFGLDAPKAFKDETDRSAQLAAIAATLDLPPDAVAELTADADRLIAQRAQR